MNKKTLLIKIVEFIHRANLVYLETGIGDMMLLVVILLVTIFGNIATAIFTILIFGLRAIYELDILERLGVINEEENTKNNDEEIVENT